jgi:Asp/Glu/hydantoin racemase
MSESKRKVAFVHTGAPAIPPLVRYYSEAAPDLDVVNLLEDGLLSLLAEGRHDTVHARLRSMVLAGHQVYGAEMAMITCSSVPLAMANSIAAETGIPVLKIDGPMALKAVQLGSRVGVAVTFRPTIDPTSRLLREMAAGRKIELVTTVIEGAYDALLAGDTATHDALLLDGVERLAGQNVDAIVLAQVSMARARQAAQARVSMPVLSSVDTSLSAIRELLAAH